MQSYVSIEIINQALCGFSAGGFLYFDTLLSFSRHVVRFLTIRR